MQVLPVRQRWSLTAGAYPSTSAVEGPGLWGQQQLLLQLAGHPRHGAVARGRLLCFVSARVS